MASQSIFKKMNASAFIFLFAVVCMSVFINISRASSVGQRTKQVVTTAKIKNYFVKILAWFKEVFLKIAALIKKLPQLMNLRKEVEINVTEIFRNDNIYFSNEVVQSMQKVQKPEIQPIFDLLRLKAEITEIKENVDVLIDGKKYTYPLKVFKCACLIRSNYFLDFDDEKGGNFTLSFFKAILKPEDSDKILDNALKKVGNPKIKLV